jgi:hypothetical protein
MNLLDSSFEFATGSTAAANERKKKGVRSASGSNMRSRARFMMSVSGTSHMKWSLSLRS